jgi:hypothetical protein
VRSARVFLGRLPPPGGLDDCIEPAIEASGVCCGGGGQGERFRGVIEVGRAGAPIEARVRHVRDWPGARADVAQYVVGPLVDRWHGPFDDLETIEGRPPRRPPKHGFMPG